MKHKSPKRTKTFNIIDRVFFWIIWKKGKPKPQYFWYKNRRKSVLMTNFMWRIWRKKVKDYFVFVLQQHYESSNLFRFVGVIVYFFFIQWHLIIMDSLLDFFLYFTMRSTKGSTNEANFFNIWPHQLCKKFPKETIFNIWRN